MRGRSSSACVVRVLAAQLPLWESDPDAAQRLATIGRALLLRAQLDEELPRRRGLAGELRAVEDLRRVELPLAGRELGEERVPLGVGAAARVGFGEDELVLALRRHPRAGRRAVKVADLVPLSGGFSKEMARARVLFDDGAEEDLVVRRVALGRSAEGLAAEYEVLRWATSRSIPVPAPWWYDPDALGSPAMVTGLVPGQTRGDVEGWSSAPSDAAVRALGSVLGSLHAQGLEGIGRTPLPALVDATDRRTALAERRSVLEALWSDDDTWAPAFERVLNWLEEHVPERSPEPVLVHGDFGPHNLMMRGDEVTAVLDWERAHPGVPAEDLAYVRPVLTDGEWDRLLAAYRAAGGAEVPADDLAWYAVWQDLWRAVSAYRMRSMFLQRPEQLSYAISGLILAPRFLDSALQSVGRAESSPC